MSVMVWGGISWHGKTEIVFTKGFYKNSKSGINSKVDTNLLKHDLLSFEQKKYQDENWEFLQDNAPIHKSKIALKWFNGNSIQFIVFPPGSPDLNPIEKIWKELKDMVETDNPSNLKELRFSIKKNGKKLR
ncbi:hypothetical protein M0812_19417 [Anaeramoeba flamelloides]|uniref:Tc1-like transposase DDE domain-containing protein n=1 Tax=Anaeramoeba flamelloides TaxID=1746091 RepID=A0AAV7Z4X2_9EUKA|nr:hypothetical protein M0812_19417 [Anaeramoeba flamelloides]